MKHLDFDNPFGTQLVFEIDEAHFLGAIRRVDKEVNRGQRFDALGPVLSRIEELELRQASSKGDVWYREDRPGGHGLVLCEPHTDRIVCSMVDRLSYTHPAYQKRDLTFKLGYLLMQAYPEIIRVRAREFLPRSYTIAGEASMRSGYRAFKAAGVFIEPQEQQT